MRIRVCVSFILRSVLTSLRICTVACAHATQDILWIVDRHGYRKPFIVRTDEIVTAFMELETAIHEFAVSLIA